MLQLLLLISYFYGKIIFKGGDVMQLIIIGLIFVIGLFIYYLLSTSSSSENKKKKKSDLKQKDNVIFLSDDIDKIKKSHHIGGDK